MIVWIVSYPRSGNTLMRGFLRQVFELPSFSIYPVENSRGTIGFGSYTGSFEEFYLYARRSRQVFMIKTHHPPIDDAPAIVMARDARASIVSYYHFLLDHDKVDVTLPQVIRGEVGIGTWSQILDTWNPLRRPRTLLLHFEDVLADSDGVTELLSDFLEQKPRCSWENEFPQLRDKYPRFFRAGDNQKNIRELNPKDEESVWQCHRLWMERLGYHVGSKRFRSAMTGQTGFPPHAWFRLDDPQERIFTVPAVDPDQEPLSQEGDTVDRRLFEQERALQRLWQKIEDQAETILRLEREPPKPWFVQFPWFRRKSG